MIYAGIDEAGYGPMFGPLVVGRFAFHVEDAPHERPDAGPDLWHQLETVVCRDLKSARRGRIAVNDSKKLHTSAVGLRHLELGVLAFAALAGVNPPTVDRWLDALGEKTHHDLHELPWYQPDTDRPWQALPTAITIGQLAVARSMLAAAARSADVRAVDLGADVVFEDRFNRMVGATRSKAAASFTFVAHHLQTLWKRFGDHNPLVIVDRQSGRTHYRSLLAMNFPHEQLTILYEHQDSSAYLLDSRRAAAGRRQMTIIFQVDGESDHMPVALASMISKYTRELLMARFKTWFATLAPAVKPTAGYARDAQRFWQQIQPALKQHDIHPRQLRRSS